MLGSPIPYLKGMRILMFQLSGFCFKVRGLVATIGLDTQTCIISLVLTRKCGNGSL